MSKFIRVYRDTGGVLLVSTLLENKLKIKTPNLKELGAIIEFGTDSVSTELEQFLYRRGYLVDEQIAESGADQLMLMSNRTLILTLVHSEFSHADIDDHSCGLFAVSSRAEHIKEFIENQLNTKMFFCLQINWICNNPNAFSGTIFDINYFAKTKANEHGIYFYSRLNSGGILPNTKIFKRMYRYGVTDYQILLRKPTNHDGDDDPAEHKTLIKGMRSLIEISKLPRDYSFLVRWGNVCLCDIVPTYAQWRYEDPKDATKTQLICEFLSRFNFTRMSDVADCDEIIQRLSQDYRFYICYNSGGSPARQDFAQGFATQNAACPPGNVTVNSQACANGNVTRLRQPSCADYPASYFFRLQDSLEKNSSSSYIKKESFVAAAKER